MFHGSFADGLLTGDLCFVVLSDTVLTDAKVAVLFFGMWIQFLWCIAHHGVHGDLEVKGDRLYWVLDTGWLNL